MLLGAEIDVFRDVDQLRAALDVEPRKVETETTGVRRDVLRYSSGWAELGLGQAGDPHDGVAREAAVELHNCLLFEMNCMLRHATMALCPCRAPETPPVFRD